MIIILYILGVLLLMLAALLLLPWRFRLQAANQPALDIEAELKWASGMLGFRAWYNREGFDSQLLIFGFRKSLSSVQRKTGTDSGPKESKRKPRKGARSDYLNPAMITSFTRLLRSLVRALRLDVNLNGRYGFEEPDITAMAALLISFLDRGCAINLKPDYSRAIADISGYIRGRVIIAQILGIGVRFLFSMPFRAIWWPRIRSNKKRKELIQYA